MSSCASDDQFKTYLFSYNYDGSKWGFEIQARDADDAIARVRRLAFAQYDGELKLSIPATPDTAWRSFARKIRFALGMPVRT